MIELSILIAAQNKIEALERTLISVLERSPPRSEIVVILNGPYSDPYHLEGEVRFVRVDDGAALVDSLNAGIVASHGEFVHVLGAGATVTDDWTDAALERLADNQVAAVAPRIVYDDEPTRVHSAGLRYRSAGAYQLVAHGDSTEHFMSLVEPIHAPHVVAGFYRRAALARLGELFPKRLGDLLATVDLGLRLERAGYRVEPETRSVVRADRAALLEPAMGFTAGIEAERLFWRNVTLRGAARSLAAHAAEQFVESLRAVTAPRRAMHLLGRMAAICEYPSYVRHWHDLAQPRTSNDPADSSAALPVPPPLGLGRQRRSHAANRSHADA